MTLDEVRALLSTFERWARGDPDGDDLLAPFLRTASGYAHRRVEWYLAPVEQRQALDAPRRAAHDAFISTCRPLSRAMGHPSNAWYANVGEVREDQGDFACLVHAALGLAAR